ncbi:unnamed protein product [Cochlearia groenlandica]
MNIQEIVLHNRLAERKDSPMPSPPPPPPLLDLARSLSVNASPYTIVEYFAGNEEKTLRLVSSLVEKVETGAISSIPMLKDKGFSCAIQWIGAISENECEHPWLFYHCDKNPLFEPFCCIDLS